MQVDIAIASDSSDYAQVTYGAMWAAGTNPFKIEVPYGSMIIEDGNTFKIKDPLTGSTTETYSCDLYPDFTDSHHFDS